MATSRADVRPAISAAAINLADAVLRMGPVRIMRNDDEVRCRICGVHSRTGKIRHVKGCAYAAYEKVRKRPPEPDEDGGMPFEMDTMSH